MIKNTKGGLYVSIAAEVMFNDVNIWLTLIREIGISSYRSFASSVKLESTGNFEFRLRLSIWNDVENFKILWLHSGKNILKCNGFLKLNTVRNFNCIYDN